MVVAYVLANCSYKMLGGIGECEPLGPLLEFSKGLYNPILGGLAFKILLSNLILRCLNLFYNFYAFIVLRAFPSIGDIWYENH